MPSVVVNDVSLHMQRLGDAGSPMIMLHGALTGSLAQWYFTSAPALAKAHRVLLYDLRGHGRSERTLGGYDLATMAQDLAALGEHVFGATPVHLVGHSYGALIALQRTIDAPQSVRSLVLVEAPLPVITEAHAEQGPQIVQRLLAELPESARALMMGSRRQASRMREHLEFLGSTSRFFADLAMRADFPDEQLQERVRCPVLLIYGSGSDVVHVGHRLARVLPAAQLQILPGSHYVQLEQPAAVTEAIAAFHSEHGD